MMHWFSDYGHPMGYGFGWLFMVLFWAAIILLVFYVVKQLTRKNGAEKKENRAEEILKERYAKGEISREEFERMKKEISL